jgi:hypothetical protein
VNINLHIERLMLDGLSVASGEAALLQAAVQTELGRLLANQRFTPAESSALAYVGGGEIHLRPGVSARELGVEIGRNVFASLIPYGFAQPGQANRVPGLSARPDLPGTSKAPSPLRFADAYQKPISSNRFVGVNQGNAHSNHSTQTTTIQKANTP